MAQSIGRHRYRLTHHAEEFGCPTCGAPVYVGDVAIEEPDGPYCSWYCAGADPHKAMAELAKARREEGNSSGNLFDGVG